MRKNIAAGAHQAGPCANGFGDSALRCKPSKRCRPSQGHEIDDFGTGFSSLSQFTKLPVQTLKIDRSFIAGLPDAHDDVAVVEAICAMAHKLCLQVLAERVETAAQSFFFSRPLPTPEFEVAWLVEPRHDLATTIRSATRARHRRD